MAYLRTHPRRLAHRDSWPKPRRRVSGPRTGSGKKMAKATIPTLDSVEWPATSPDAGIVETHTDDLVEKDDE